MFKVTYPVEFPLLICFFCCLLLDPILQNLYIYRTCYATMGYNKSDCALLGKSVNEKTKSLETLVQPLVNHIEMVMRVSETAVPIILSMFIGSWSDRFGRKPFLIIGLSGLSLTQALNAIFSHCDYLSPWFFVISAVPSMFTGGHSTVYIIVTLYITDITSAKNRVFRMGIVEGVMAIARLSGSLSFSYLLYATNYETVFTMAASLFVISVIYTALCLSESIKVESKEVPSVGKIIAMMNFREILKTTFKKRENNKRKHILLLMGMIICYNMVYKGNLSVRTLFLRKKLQWTLKKVSFGTCYFNIMYITGAILGTVILYKKLKMRESHLVILAIATQSTASILMALATNDYYIFAAYTASVFAGVVILLLRTLLSYLVASNELGKIYTTFNAMDNLMSILTTACIYPLVYNATINIDSGLYNYMDLGGYFVTFFIMLYLIKQDIPHSRDEILANSQQKEEHEQSRH